jgi:hypothetical protein
MQYEFGTGQLFGKSLNSGVQTPVQFGALQGVSIDFTFTQKELYSQYQFPVALARGTAKITGKADFAQFNAQVFNDLFFGASSVANGVVRAVTAEAQTVTANTATATNGGNFVQDLGVVRASDGAVYTRVANTPTGLQYVANESNGVYSFNSSQNNVQVLINYTWNDSANGKKIAITNQLLGVSPQFTAVFTNKFTIQGVPKQITMVLNACMSSKLSLATKLEDFTIPSFDFSAFADAANAIGSISVDE